jgi:hypothetical protein
MYQRMLVVFGLFVLTTFVGPAIAQTPDGATPLDEGICDDLIGATAGLYGLCLAYCESMDCELIDDAVQCDGVADPVLLDNYNRRKQAGDLEMPCFVPGPCPCWTENEVNDIAPIPAFPGPDACHNDLNLANFSSETCTGLNNSSSPTDPCRGIFGFHLGGASVSHDPLNPRFDRRLTCFYVRGGSLGDRIIARGRRITPAQAQVCSDQLVARGVADGGWSCF